MNSIEVSLASLKGQRTIATADGFASSAKRSFQGIGIDPLPACVSPDFSPRIGASSHRAAPIRQEKATGA